MSFFKWITNGQWLQMNMTSNAGYDSKSSSVQIFPVSGSGSWKSGGLNPRETPLDSVLAARTTSFLGGDGGKGFRSRGGERLKFEK